MIHDVMTYFGLEREFKNPGAFYETENSKQLYLDLRTAIKAGHLVALTGIVGSGKTTLSRKIRKDLAQEDILISTSIAIDKERVSKSSLLQALFADINVDKKMRLPNVLELKERTLRDLIKQRKKPIALFIDEAHELHHKTLLGLKNLMEMVYEVDAVLSVILVGYPKLSHDLKRPTMESIGARTTVLKMEGIKGHEMEYFTWLLKHCLKKGSKQSDVFTEEAMKLLTDRLSTPLQLNYYAWQALVEAHRTAQRPVEVDTVEITLSKELDSLDARLRRLGYTPLLLADALDARPSEIKALLRGRLEPARNHELHTEMLKLGIIG